MNESELVVDAALSFQRLHPRKYLERFVREGVRPDGRGLQEYRSNLVVEAGNVQTADGSATVKIGKTCVACGVRYLVMNNERMEEEGQVRVKVHLLPVCSSEYTGKASGLSNTLTEFLSNVTQHMVDKKELLIGDEGEACFVLQVDAVCMSDDGNLLDASLLAIIAALKNLRLPTVQFIPEKKEVVQIGKDATNPIEVTNLPVPTTFGIFQNQILVDPTHEEQQIIDGTMTIVVNQFAEIAGIFKPDGPSIPMEQLDQCIELAQAHANTVFKTLL